MTSSTNGQSDHTTPRRVRARTSYAQGDAAPLLPTSPMTPPSVTPQTTPVAKLEVPTQTKATLSLQPLNEEETDKLSSMVASSQRHSAGNIALPEQIALQKNLTYLESRCIAIDWMLDVCKQFSCSLPTFHAAVRHMDWFMARCVVSDESIELVAIAAFFVASKTEEIAEKVPLVKDLVTDPSQKQLPQRIRDFELIMLDHFKWDVIVQTPAHFLMFFIAILSRRMENKPPLVSAKRVLAKDPLFHSERICSISQLECEEELDEEPGSDESVSGGECAPADGLRLFSTGEGLGAAATGQSAPLAGGLEEISHKAVGLLDLAMSELAIWSRTPPALTAAAAIAVACHDVGEKRFSREDVAALCGVDITTLNAHCETLDGLKVPPPVNLASVTAKQTKKRSRAELF